jgi:hypothetical protein
MKNKSLSSRKALDHVHHAIYLQWFIGIIVVALPFLSNSGLPVVHVDEKIVGGVFTLLGLNVWFYLRRYERLLSSSDHNVDGKLSKQSVQ